MIITKAGRCIVNCGTPSIEVSSEKVGQGGCPAAAGVQTQLAVGDLCRLLVTMHTFSGSEFLSYVVIGRFGVRRLPLRGPRTVSLGGKLSISYVAALLHRLSWLMADRTS